MSSTSIGNQFEDEVRNWLEREIKADRTYLKADCCRVFQKKGYYSKDREKNIIFDISIEVYMPGAAEYSQLLIVECKNYNHAVPIDDVEEFYAKIEQIGLARVKGVIASASSFQSSALKYAQSKGMGLLRYFSGATPKWDLYRQPYLSNNGYLYANDSSVLRKALTTESFRSETYSSYGYSNFIFTNSLLTFLRQLIATSNLDDALLQQVKNYRLPRRIHVGFVSPEDIERRSLDVLQTAGYSVGEAPLDRICQHESELGKLTVIRDATPSEEYSAKGILGTIKFNPSEITLFASQEQNIFRQRFTLAHELGHFFLGHSEHMAGEYCEEKDFRLEANVPDKSAVQRMEWQANYFASCLLLPKKAIISDFLSLANLLELKDKGFGILYLNEQRGGRMKYHAISNYLEAKYKVSRTVVKIRLQGLNLLTYGCKPRAMTKSFKDSDLTWTKVDLSRTSFAAGWNGVEEGEAWKDL